MGEEFIDKAIQRANQMIESGLSKEQILSFLAITAERFAGGQSVASVLLLDDEGLLRNGASPGLPEDYLAAIDGIKPDPNVGTCAAVAATGTMVITEDFCADDKWAELRHLPMALGFTGAWSLPIINAEGKILGTFGTYYRTKRRPTPAEISLHLQLIEVMVKVLQAEEVNKDKGYLNN
ncbi:MAG: GAF domain-containing protein [Cytophagaceae bacterium]